MIFKNILHSNKSEIKVKCLIKNFTRLRTKTPALKLLLVPDEFWSKFKKYCLEDLNEAYHQSILLLAHKRGYLFKIIEI